MCHFTLKIALKGIVSILVAASSSYAVVVDTFDNDSKNEFGHNWYYYDDDSQLGDDTRSKDTSPGTPSMVNVPYSDSIRHAFGDTSDKKIIKAYTFVTGSEFENRYATMPFTLGSTWETSYGEANPYVGIGTQLVAAGKSIDLTGVTAVKFKIRSHTGKTSVIVFRIQTLALEKYSEVTAPGDGAYAYHEKSVPVTKDWIELTVPVSTLKQPAWLKSTSPGKFAFDIKTCTKLVWEVNLELNDSLNVGSTDTLDIDDIALTDNARNIHFFHPTTVSTPSSGKFATFDDLPYNQSSFKTYWYVYDDYQISGLRIEEGAEIIQNNQKLPNLDDLSGSDGVGRSIDLSYWKNPGDSAVKKGTIGICCNLYDSATTHYWDAKKAGVNSIYFQYATFGSVTNLTLEILDSNDVNPTEKKRRGNGVVWHRDFPVTYDNWNGVEILFDSLICDKDSTGSPNIPLDKTKLAKVQFKFQALEKNGAVAVDNVYFPGLVLTSPTSVLHGLHITKHSPFNALYLNGNIHIKFNNETVLSTGKISLFKAQGTVIATMPITKTRTRSADFPAKNLAPGLYLVKIDAIDIDGKAVVLQSSVTVTR